jgi:hypothetical protein
LTPEFKTRKSRLLRGGWPVNSPDPFLWNRRSDFFIFEKLLSQKH